MFVVLCTQGVRFMVPGSFRKKRFHRVCRPSLRIRRRGVGHGPGFDSRAYMEYQNFLMFQERMCSVLQITTVMFVLWLFAVVLMIVVDALNT